MAGLEEPTGREVRTPHVDSRRAAWAAFEATLLGRYTSMRRKQIEKNTEKAQLAFNETLENRRDRPWMFAHATRWRRGEVQVEPIDGEGRLEWVKLKDIWSLSSEYLIHPNFEFYRTRQLQLLELKEEGYRGFGIEPGALFKEGFYRFEMTPEQAAEADRIEEEERQAWLDEREKTRVAREREAEERQKHREEQIETMRTLRMLRYIEDFLDIPEDHLRQVLINSGPMFRVLHLVSEYPSIDSLTMEILASTISACDRDMTKKHAHDMIAIIYGYTDFEVAKLNITNGKLENMLHGQPRRSEWSDPVPDQT